MEQNAGNIKKEIVNSIHWVIKIKSGSSVVNGGGNGNSGDCYFSGNDGSGNDSGVDMAMVVVMVVSSVFSLS